MEKRTELFVNSYLYPVLVPLTVALGTMLLSKFATGDWLKYVHSLRVDTPRLAASGPCGKLGV